MSIQLQQSIKEQYINKNEQIANLFDILWENVKDIDVFADAIRSAVQLLILDVTSTSIQQFIQKDQQINQQVTDILQQSQNLWELLSAKLNNLEQWQQIFFDVLPAELMKLQLIRQNKVRFICHLFTQSRSKIINNHNQYKILRQFLQNYIEVSLQQCGSCDLCSICLSQQGTQCCVLKCSHSFHRKCLLNWIAMHNTCPLCRQSIIDYNTALIQQQLMTMYSNF